MEQLLKFGSRLANRYVAAVLLILVVGFGYAYVTGLNPAARGDLLHKAQEFLPVDRKSTRLNSSHIQKSRMPSSA